MADDVSSAAGGKASSPLSSGPRKLIYALGLATIYAILIFISYGYKDFLIFFLIGGSDYRPRILLPFDRGLHGASGGFDRSAAQQAA